MFLNDAIVARLLRMPIGERTNEALYYLLAPHLLGYWTFPKPEQDGREIGDLLFIFGDVCIIFEAKTRATPDTPSKGWIRSRLRDAVSQINDDYRRLSGGEVRTLRNQWRGEVTWASLGIRYYQGVIVMMHQSDPYDPRDLEPSIIESPIPVHVLSLFDLSELIRLMNTPWDFVVYLEFRHRLGRKYELTVHREQSVYWGILSEWPRLAREQRPDLEDTKLEDDARFLRSYTHAVMHTSDVDDESKTKIAASYLLDIAAGSLMNKANKNNTGKRVGGPDHELLVRTVELITELSRRRRAEYGLLWLTVAQKAIVSGKAEIAKGYSLGRNRSYVYIAHPTSDLSPPELLAIARRRMRLDQSTAVVVVTATATSIVATYNSIRASMDGQHSDDNDVLDATALIIDRT